MHVHMHAYRYLLASGWGSAKEQGCAAALFCAGGTRSVEAGLPHVLCTLLIGSPVQGLYKGGVLVNGLSPGGDEHIRSFSLEVLVLAAHQRLRQGEGGQHASRWAGPCRWAVALSAFGPPVT